MITADRSMNCGPPTKMTSPQKSGHYISLAKIEHLMTRRINLGS